MELPRKQAETVRKALEHWRDEGLLDEATGKRLLDDLVPMSFDWHRLGRYAMWTSVACILIGVVSLFTDRWLIEFIERFITLTGLGRCVLSCGGGAVRPGGAPARPFARKAADLRSGFLSRRDGRRRSPRLFRRLAQGLRPCL